MIRPEFPELKFCDDGHRMRQPLVLATITLLTAVKKLMLNGN